MDHSEGLGSSSRAQGGGDEGGDKIRLSTSAGQGIRPAVLLQP